MSPRLLVLLAALAAGCAGPGATSSGMPGQAPLDSQPFVVVLGTAQDGGLPQIGCLAECCERAAEGPSMARRVTSLLLVDPRDGRRWLFDASPDIGAQLRSADGFAPRVAFADGARAPLFDGLFLTHAHSGHYAGLLQLGREAYGVGGVIYASERMAAFLRGNAPWSAVVDGPATELRGVAPGEPIELARDLTVEALRVPHRDEYSDTYAWLVRGPNAALLYLPDIDKWERWDVPIEELLADVDVALLDGTFFGPAEVPGRDLGEIPHPFIVESLARFEPLSAELRARVHFTHLNHTNPAADPGSAAARRVRDAGLHVARDLDVHGL